MKALVPSLENLAEGYALTDTTAVDRLVALNQVEAASHQDEVGIDALVEAEVLDEGSFLGRAVRVVESRALAVQALESEGNHLGLFGEIPRDIPLVEYLEGLVKGNSLLPKAFDAVADGLFNMTMPRILKDPHSIDAIQKEVRRLCKLVRRSDGCSVNDKYVVSNISDALKKLRERSQLETFIGASIYIIWILQLIAIIPLAYYYGENAACINTIAACLEFFVLGPITSIYLLDPKSLSELSPSEFKPNISELPPLVDPQLIIGICENLLGAHRIIEQVRERIGTAALYQVNELGLADKNLAVLVETVKGVSEGYKESTTALIQLQLRGETAKIIGNL